MNRKQLDKQIETAWRKLAQGVQVNVMDIRAIFDLVRQGVNEGRPMDDCVNEAIATYRQN